MKKLISIIAALALILGCAGAEISINDGGYSESLWSAVFKTGADCAYCCADGETVYYVKDSAVYVSGAYSAKIADLAQDDSYPAVAADENGNVYVLRNDSDSTAKPSVICLAPENGRYYALDYVMPGAGENLRAESMYISDTSSVGFMFSALNGTRVFSVLGVFWGSLTGYDEFILIDSASGLTCAIPAEDCFDAYGYINETGTELTDGIASGRYISPDEASVSADGQSMLLLGGGRVFVMDTVTLEITEPALPDGFSGTVGWEGNELYAVSDSGVKTALTLGWQAGDEWTMGSDFGSESGFDVDWSAPGSGDLGDWS